MRIETVRFLPLAPPVRHATLRRVTDLELTVHAAKEAGKLLKANFGLEAAVDEATHHDIKLALDKESQKLIEEILLGARPGDALYGEEGMGGNPDSDRQWIVDPIDGTVNFYYGIPHFCVSIALREKVPMLDGRPISVSKRTKLEECALFVGCGKDEEALRTGLERFRKASLKARKMRMMGSAALGMAYIASGRLDGYIESRISLWDIAAGQLLVEAAGGKVLLEPAKDCPDAWAIVATNGKIPIEEIL
jgi:myo-inositol-1(or 4)-monophosphatase